MLGVVRAAHVDRQARRSVDRLEADVVVGAPWAVDPGGDAGIGLEGDDLLCVPDDASADAIGPLETGPEADGSLRQFGPLHRHRQPAQRVPRVADEGEYLADGPIDGDA